jgi:hypothetical protein
VHNVKKLQGEGHEAPSKAGNGRVSFNEAMPPQPATKCENRGRTGIIHYLSCIISLIPINCNLSRTPINALSLGRMNESFTLDTNCVIAVEDARPEATAVRRLADAHATGYASVALLAISASERQKDGAKLKFFTQFKERLALLGLGHLELLKPLAYFDICYIDWCVLADEDSLAIEERIHKILFPNIPFFWPDYCKECGISPDASSVGTRWGNAKCDVLAYWSHVHNKRKVFVTSDGNFHKEKKRAALLNLFGGEVMLPSEAARRVSGSTDGTQSFL